MRTIIAFISIITAYPLVAQNTTPSHLSQHNDQVIRKLNYPNACVKITSGSMTNTSGPNSAQEIKTPNGKILFHEVLINGNRISWTCTPSVGDDIYKISVTSGGATKTKSIVFSGADESLVIDKVDITISK